MSPDKILSLCYTTCLPRAYFGAMMLAFLNYTQNIPSVKKSSLKCRSWIKSAISVVLPDLPFLFLLFTWPPFHHRFTASLSVHHFLTFTVIGATGPVTQSLRFCPINFQPPAVTQVWSPRSLWGTCPSRPRRPAGPGWAHTPGSLPCQTSGLVLLVLREDALLWAEHRSGFLGKGFLN